MAPPSDAQIIAPPSADPTRVQQQQPQLSDTVATVTASGATNHHVIHHGHAPAPPPRTGALAPHHPLHPQHVQAAVHHHQQQLHPQMAGPVQPAPPLGPPPPIMGPPLMHPMVGSSRPQMAPPSQMMMAPYSNFQHPYFGPGNNGGNGAPYEDNEELQLEEEPTSDFCGENYINVDRFFLVAMPCLFLVFNIVYWFAYGSNFILSASDDEDER